MIPVAGRNKVVLVSNLDDEGSIRVVTAELAPHLLEQTGQHVSALDQATLDHLIEKVKL